MRSLLTIFMTMAALSATACLKQPQSRAEFVAVASADEKVVPQDFEAVAALVEERSRSCLAKFVNKSGMVGGTMEVASAEYRPTFQRVAEGRAELTLQVAFSPRPVGAGPIPPGGMYLIAADIVREGPSSTRYRIFRPTFGHGDVIDAIRQWLEGKRADCPGF